MTLFLWKTGKMAKKTLEITSIQPSRTAEKRPLACVKGTERTQDLSEGGRSGHISQQPKFSRVICGLFFFFFLAGLGNKDRVSLWGSKYSTFHGDNSSVTL